MRSVEVEQPCRLGDTLHALAQGDNGRLPSLQDTLYNILWKRIVNLEFSPGSRISDELIARELGVSRTPVREALYRLSQAGLVRIKARHGFFVPTVSREDAIEVYDLRIALETFATRVAAPLLTAADLAPHLERQQRVRARATSHEPAHIEEFVHSDLFLHDLLVQRTSNQRMRQTLADLAGQLSIVYLRIATLPRWRLAAIQEHGLILDALAARNTTAAAEAMEAHLYGVKERVLEDFEQLEQ